MASPSRASQFLADGLPENHAEFRRRIVEDVRQEAVERWHAYHDHQARKELETSWKLMDQMIRCDLDENEKQEIGRANISPPTVHDAWMTKTARTSEVLFASSEKFVELQALGATPKELADLAGEAVQADFEMANLDVKGPQAVAQTYKYGNCFIHIPWRTTRRWRKRRLLIDESVRLVRAKVGGQVVTMPQESADEIGAEIRQVLDPYRGPVEIDEFMSVFDGPDLEVLPIESLYADTTIREIQNQDCVILYDEISESRIRTLGAMGLYANTDKISPALIASQGGMGREVTEDRESNFGLTSSFVRGREFYPRLRIWVRLKVDEERGKLSSSAFPNWWRVTLIGVGNDATCVELRRNPYWDGQLPFIHVWHRPDELGLYHQSDADTLYPAYKVAATLMCQAIDNRTLSNWPMFKFVHGGILDRDLTPRPGRGYRMSRSTKELEEFRPTLFQQGETLALLEYVDRWMRGSTSATKEVMGQPFPSHTTAVAAQISTQAATAPISQDIRTMDRLLVEAAAEMFIARRTQFTDTPQTVRLRNGQVVQYDRTAFMGDFRVISKGVTEFEHKATRRQNIMQVAQLLSGMGDPMMTLKVMEKVIEEFDMSDDFLKEIAGLRQRVEGMIQGQGQGAPPPPQGTQ